MTTDELRRRPPHDTSRNDPYAVSGPSRRAARWGAVVAAALTLAAPTTAAHAAGNGQTSAPVDTVIGTSTAGRPIVARRHRAGTGDGPVIVVVGSIHGNEQSGLQIVDTFNRLLNSDPTAAGRLPAGATVWTIRTVNPDGTAANTRHNANGVDLNRNFPTGWQPRRCPAKTCAGNGPASEAETVAVAAFFDTVDPDLVIWYHSVGGDVVDRPATATGRRLAAAYVAASATKLVTFPCGNDPCSGTATMYLNRRPGTGSFVVELRCDNRCLTSRDIGRHIDGIVAAANVISRRPAGH